MTLSEAIRKCISDYFAVRLEAEHRKGRANTVDFLGISPVHGEIRVELEKRRADPTNNVVKAWRQAHENPAERSFTMVHVFSGYYRGANSSKLENARFVGERMVEWGEGRGIKYVAISLGFEPRENPERLPETDLPETAKRLICDEIRRQLDAALPSSTRTAVDSASAPVAGNRHSTNIDPEVRTTHDGRMNAMSEDDLVKKLEKMIAAGDKTAMEALFGVVFHADIERVSNAKRIAERAADVKTNSNINLGIRLAKYVTVNDETTWRNS